MPTDKKRSRKKRGHVSSGHGRIGKHRKHPGGRGNAGGQHHHKILFEKYYSGFFGKRGMRSFRKTKQKSYCPTVNIDRVHGLISQIKEVNINKKYIIPTVNLSNLGSFKLLGKGKLLNVPIIFKSKFFSKKAKDKIQKSGGSCIVIP
jgi:large subunit ribosomal protein L27Ae